jgi:hypothetical protein
VRRARVTLAGDPLVQDGVVAAPDRDTLGLPVFPRFDDARRLSKLPPTLPATEVLAQPPVRAFFQTLLNRLWQKGTGSANRPARLMLMSQAPRLTRVKSPTRVRPTRARCCSIVPTSSGGCSPTRPGPTCCCRAEWGTAMAGTRPRPRAPDGLRPVGPMHPT